MSLISCGQVQLSTNVIMTLRSQFEGGCYPLLAVYFQKYMKQKQPPEVFCEKVVFKNFAMFTGKHLCQSLFFNKVTVPSSAALLKKRPLHRCFRVNIVKFLRMLILKNACERLLLMKIDFEKTNKLCPLGNEVAKSFSRQTGYFE